MKEKPLKHETRFTYLMQNQTNRTRKKNKDSLVKMQEKSFIQQIVKEASKNIESESLSMTRHVDCRLFSALRVSREKKNASNTFLPRSGKTFYSMGRN